MTQEEMFWWNWFVTLFATIGTISAVLVALFGQVIKNKVFPPLLEANLLKEGGEKTQALVNESTTKVGARYYHLRVVNSRRWSNANNVRVFLVRVETPGPDGLLQTNWAGEAPIRWRFQEHYPLERTIGAQADCDLCSVVQDHGLSLHPIIVPFNLVTHWQSAVSIVITLQVRSDEVDSGLIRIKVDWDGKWEDGEIEMKKHLVVRQMA